MEKLNKEEIFTDIEECKQHYLEIIENQEKDYNILKKEHNAFIDLSLEAAKGYEQLLLELQQAKDLLKELKGNLIYINEESMNIGCEEEIKKIEEFLNK